MLIKNHFGFTLYVAILIYLLDIIWHLLVSLIAGHADEAPLIIKAIFWNLCNLKDTLMHRCRFKNENINFFQVILTVFWSMDCNF